MSDVTAERRIAVSEVETARIDVDHLINAICSASAQVTQVSFERDRSEIKVRYDGSEAELDELLARVRKMAVGSELAYPPRVVFDRPGLSPHSPDTIWHQLTENEWVHDFGSGHVGCSGPLLALMERLDELIVQASRALGAAPLHFPSTVPVELLERSGVLEHYPQEVFFVAPLSRGIDQIEAYRCAPDRADGRRLSLHLESAHHGLKTSACCMIYPMLAGKRLAAPRHFTVHGQCSRHESGALDTLARLSEFRMREVVYVGDAAYLPAFERGAIALLEALFAALDLRGCIMTASDPFFISKYEQYRFFQMLGGDKLEARIALGETGATTAFASFNRHRDFFSRRYDIMCADAPAVTACIGFGLERFCLGLLCRYGLDWTTIDERIGQAADRLNHDGWTR